MSSACNSRIILSDDALIGVVALQVPNPRPKAMKEDNSQTGPSRVTTATNQSLSQLLRGCGRF